MGQCNNSAKLLYVLGQQSELAMGVLNGFFVKEPVEVSCDGRIAPQRVESECTLLFLDGASKRSDGVENLATTGFKKNILFNLDDLNLVRLSSEVPHDLFWISSTEPTRRLGGLVENFQGAYLRGEELVVSIGNETTTFLVPDANPLPSSFKTIVLAGALSAKLHKLPEEKIQEGIKKAIQILSKPEWKVFSEINVKETL